MDKTLQVQAQIRQNAEGISSALSEMSKWEKQMKIKDKKILEGASTKGSRPIRSGAGTVPIKSISPSQNTGVTDNRQVPSSSAFDSALTPSSIVNKFTGDNNTVVHLDSAVPKARGVFLNRDPEEAERERGNTEFKAGNFTAAVKSYTKCLGLKSRNYVAFSNRAMAYLKLKEYNRAVADCSGALSIEPSHVKSLLRRATAYNVLGKHRAALVDLSAASELEPTNKQVRSELHTSRELLRNAVNRAPAIPVPIRFDAIAAPGGAGSAAVLPLQGPDPAPAPSVGPGLGESGDSSGGSVTVSDFLRVKKKNSPETALQQASVVPTASTGAAAADGSSSHRIPIREEEEDEDEDEGDRKEGSSDNTQQNSTRESDIASLYASKSVASSRIVIQDDSDGDGDGDDVGDNETDRQQQSQPTISDSAITATKEGTTGTTGIADMLKSSSSGGARKGETTDSDKKAKANRSTTVATTVVDTISNATVTSNSVVDEVDVSGSGNTSPTKSKLKKSQSSAKASSAGVSSSGSGGKTKTKGNKTAATTYSLYDLERDLLQSRMEVAALEHIFANIRVASIGSIFKSLMEPSVLYLFLKGVYVLFSSRIGSGGGSGDGDSNGSGSGSARSMQYITILTYYDKVSSVGSFRLVYSLLMAAEKAEIRDCAAEVAAHFLNPPADGDGDGDVVAVETKELAERVAKRFRV